MRFPNPEASTMRLQPRARACARSFACLLAALAAPAAANEAVFVNGFESVWVLGYHVGYEASEYPTDKVDFAAMSHVVIGVVTPNADGTLNTTYDIDPVNGPTWASGVATAAHAVSRKALLMVGGAGALGGFEGAAASNHRSAFVTNLLGEMDARGADGLDLDWEPLESPDYATFTALAQALRTARPNLILTVPVGWANANFQNPATPDPFYGTIASLFDRINVMSYDMEWPADGWQSWYTSALRGDSATTPSSIESSVAFYLASGVPRGKLGIGIGFYGVCWHGVTAARQTIGKNAGIYGSDNVYSYRNIVNDYYTVGNYHYDATTEMPYLSNSIAFGPAPGCNFLSYENAASIAAKGAYVNGHGLGGTIIWNIGEGYVPEQVGQENALLDAVNTAFHPTP